MKNRVQKILILSLLFGLVAPLIFYLFSKKEYYLIKRVEIVGKTKENQWLMSEVEILNTIAINKTLSESKEIKATQQDIEKIKDALVANPYIRNAFLVAQLNGTLQIELEQIQPLLRIHFSQGKQKILTRDSTLVNIPKGQLQKIPVVTGQIGANMISKLYTLGNYVQENPFWNATVEQIFVNKANEIQFVTNLGHFEILLGNTTNLNNKMNRSEIFIKNVLPSLGWDAYQTIDLRFKKQIIAY